MRDFSICGLLGWNYDSYYTKHGMPRSVKITKSAGGMPGAFSLLSEGRCQVLEVHPQIVIGAVVTGELKMPNNIACRNLVGDLQNFYLMVARKSPRAKELVTRLSTAIIHLKSTGKWRSIGDEGVLPASGLTDLLKCL